MEIVWIAFALQVGSLTLISFPVFYWAHCWFLSKRVTSEERVLPTSKTRVKTTIFLPMKNEITRLEEKLNRVISEIEMYQEVSLLVIESDSSDGTAERCEFILGNSNLEEGRWKVMRIEEPGKSRAVNIALEQITDEIVIMMDTDTIIRDWLRRIWSIMSHQEISVLSGVERNKKAKNARNSYRKTSNIIRKTESFLGSTPVVEGGLIAWKTEVFSGYKLNHNSNADDAQIAIEGIRRGYRTIVSEGLEFSDTKNQKFSYVRSIRRSQGLSRVLLGNSDLLVRNVDFRTKMALLNAFCTYIIVPWSVLVFCLCSPIVISDHFYTNPGFQEMINLGFFFALFMTNRGRALFWGSSVSIISHCLFLLGKNYSIWDPSK